MSTPPGVSGPALRLHSAKGHWVVAAAVLGSGVAFLDGTVVNAALPAISRDLHAGLADLQWVVTAYLLTLGALLVVGGSLGDLFGRRRIFVIGLIGFGATSLLSGAAPTIETLIAAPARCRASRRRSSCRAAWRSSRRPFTPTTGAQRSARGAASLV